MIEVLESCEISHETPQGVRVASTQHLVGSDYERAYWRVSNGQKFRGPDDYFRHFNSSYGNTSTEQVLAWIERRNKLLGVDDSRELCRRTLSDLENIEALPPEEQEIARWGEEFERRSRACKRN